MDNHELNIDQHYIENQLARAAQFFRDAHYPDADAVLKDTVQQIQNEIARSTVGSFSQNLKKGLAECFVNRAVCIFSQEESNSVQGEIEQCLETALSLDYLNFWAYFNLASYHMRYCNYIRALENLKCSLSCLYLLKAVLCKDLDNKAKQKDLGKAITLSNNNLEAQLLRLLMNIRQNRWKNARNQIGIIEEIIGENHNLQELIHIISAVEKNSDGVEKEEQLREIYQQSMVIIIEVKRESTPLRLNAVAESVQHEDFVKLINDRLYEFNELVNQVNELGSVFGLFQFRTVYRKQMGDKRAAIVSNLIAKDDKYKVSVNESLRSRQNSRMSQLTEPQIKQPQKVNESKNLESLFELTRSHNDCNLQNKQAELSGNLLSDLQNTLKPLLTVEQTPEYTTSAFNLQSIVLPNMRKKDCEIRAIESEIHPLDFHEMGTGQVNANHHYVEQNEQDDDLLLDSAFQQEPQTPAFADLNNSKRDEKVVRLFPVNQNFKYLQIFFVEMEFKPSLEDFTDIYCQIEVCGKKFRSKKVDSRMDSGRIVGEWNESLGCIQMPSEPKNIKIEIKKYESKKYLDCTLGSGEIEMANAGVNKFPIYKEERMVGIVTLKLNLHEQSLAASMSSYRPSSLSSSKKSESIRLELYQTIPAESNLLGQ